MSSADPESLDMVESSLSQTETTPLTITEPELKEEVNNAGSSIKTIEPHTKEAAARVEPQAFNEPEKSKDPEVLNENEVPNEPEVSNEPEVPNESELLESEQREIAYKLYKEEFVSIQPEEYTQFLAVNDPESNKIREYYMDSFTWSPDLLKSTRMLCSKLYLKGESQEIDRILSSFTKSYIKQHPSNIFCTRNFEKIYIILYSLILLNTALHNSEINKKSKISQADYIKNTFNTFIQQNPKSQKKLSVKQRIVIERVLSSYYEDLSKNELHLKQQDESIPSDNERQKKNRLSIVESMSSFATSSNNINLGAQYHSNSSNTAQNYLDPNINGQFRPHQQQPQSSSLTVQNYNQASPHSPSNDLPSLSKQISGPSIWSTDTGGNQRASLSMKRMSTCSSTATSYMNANASQTTLTSSRTATRVGFTRALISDQNSQKFYNDNFAVRNRQSLNHLRGAPSSTLNPGMLHRRSSRASIVSKESSQSMTGDDILSVLSLDTFNINDTELSDENHRRNMDDFNAENYQDSYDLTLELQGSPYLKEGLLKLKILNNDQQDNSTTNTTEIDQASSTPQETVAGRFFSFFTRVPAAKEAHTTTGTGSTMTSSRFTENFVVVSKGELSLYSFDPKVIKKHQQKMKKYNQTNVEDDSIGDGNWLKNAANVGNYNLCATFAQLEKSHNSNSSKVQWSLTFPKISKKPPKKFIFEAGTKEVALEFVNSCNFWAAKITAIPTSDESVSSIEYGWTNLDGLIAKKNNLKKMKNIQTWELLPQGTFLSNYVVVNNELSDRNNHLGMMKQFVRTLNYYNHLKKNFREFNQMRNKFIKNFNFKGLSNTSNYHKIMNNYDAKLGHYRFEMEKYKNYLIVLGFGLQLRFDLEEQDKQSLITDTSEGEPEGDDIEGTDSELTHLIKTEIRKLFVNMKDIGQIIPTFTSSRSLNNLSEIRKGNMATEEDVSVNPLVKSPKSNTLAQYKENKSPVAQLVQSQNANKGNFDDSLNGLVQSHKTNTIKEEEEPDSDSATGEPASPQSIDSLDSENTTTLNVAKAQIVKVNY